MDRRDAEIKAIEDAKYYHHNLGYDHEEYMQGSADLKHLEFKKAAFDEIIEAPLEEKPIVPPVPPPYEIIETFEKAEEPDTEKVELERIDLEKSESNDLEKTEVEVHSDTSAEQEAIEHFDQTVEEAAKVIEGQDEPFDSTYLRGKSERHRIDHNKLFSGLDIAVRSMKNHEKADFIIKPDYAFGMMVSMLLECCFFFQVREVHILFLSQGMPT